MSEIKVYKTTRSTRIRRAIILKVFASGPIPSADLSIGPDTEGLNGNRAALLRKGIIELQQLGRGNAQFEPEPGILGEVQQCMVDALPSSKGILMRDVLNKFAEKVNFTNIQKEFRWLRGQNIIALNLLKLTPIGLAIANRINDGEPGDPVQMVQPEDVPPSKWQSKAKAVRHRCNHVEIHSIGFRSPRDRKRQVARLADLPCPRCIDPSPPSLR